MRPTTHRICLAVLGSVLLTPIVPAQGVLKTLFASNNGLSANDSGTMFDAEVKNPKGIEITAFDVNTAATTNITIDVWVTPLTYVGIAETTKGMWWKAATGSGTGKGTDIATPIDTTDFFLPKGKYGFYINYKTGGLKYTGTGSTGPGSKYANADLALDLGISFSGVFRAGGGTRFFPRVWNGAIYYSADNKAAVGKTGKGCVGSNGSTPRMTTSAEPVLGTTISFNIDRLLNVPAETGFLFIGLAPQTIDLKVIGMPGCVLHTAILQTIGIVNLKGTATIPAPIPNAAALTGVVVYLQAGAKDAKANTLGVAASNALAIRFGLK